MEHQVVDILKSLSNEEIRRLRLFLASPYFIRTETNVSLFEELIKFHPNFNAKKLTKEYIYTKVFGEGEYNDSTYRNAMYNLLEVCELFLKQESFQKSSSVAFEYLLKELIDKKIESVFERNTQKMDKQLTPFENIDSEYYLAMHKLELNKYNYYALNKRVNESTDADIHFKEIFNSGMYLTIHYITEIIPIYLTSVFYSIQYNRPLTNNFFNKLVSAMNLKGLENILNNNEHSFIIALYISLLRTFQDMDDESAYFEYKNNLRNCVSKLGKDEISFHFDNLINYCTIKLRKQINIEFFNNELFSLYEEILQNEYYKNNKTDYLRHEFYRDILLLYLQHNKVASAENFILKYSSKLHKSEKENMVNLAYAYLYFEKNEYMQSWKYFNKINIDTFLFKYDIKSYALMIYYELGYYDEALSLIENYKRFLERNELMAEDEKKRKKNFILYLSKLIMLKVGNIPNKQYTIYRKRLELAENTSSRDWVLDKYDSFASDLKQRRQLKSA
jgi:hypothetical protein